MFDLSWGENDAHRRGWALIVIGPKDLPRTLRAVGQGRGQGQADGLESQGLLVQPGDALARLELDSVSARRSRASTAPPRAGMNPPPRPPATRSSAPSRARPATRSPASPRGARPSPKRAPRGPPKGGGGAGGFGASPQCQSPRDPRLPEACRGLQPGLALEKTSPAASAGDESRREGRAGAARPAPRPSRSPVSVRRAGREEEVKPDALGQARRHRASRAPLLDPPDRACANGLIRSLIGLRGAVLRLLRLRENTSTTSSSSPT